MWRAVWAFLLVACCSTIPAPPLTPPKPVTVQDLLYTTVALMDPDSPGPVCAGVWVSESLILTAGHCVKWLGMNPVEQMLRSMASDEDVKMPDYNPVGHEAHWRGYSDTQDRLGVLVRWSEKDDLGLILTSGPPHPVSHVREESLMQGDTVRTVGHPMGSVWSYSQGYVSNPSVDFDDKEPRLQLDISINRGNSGGGAFDAKGSLVGICSFSATNVSGLGWFVPVRIIGPFLARN